MLWAWGHDARTPSDNRIDRDRHSGRSQDAVSLMGQRGPAPKPIEIRKQDGTYKASKHGQSIVVAGKALDLEAPAHLPDAFIAVWDELVPTLTQAGLVDRVDALALEALV